MEPKHPGAALSARKERWTPSHTAALVVCLVAVFLSINAVISLNAALRLTDIRERIALTHETIEELQTLVGLVKDAEIEARGYLVTGDPHFLAPYQDAVERTESRLDEVAALFDRDREHPDGLAELETRIRSKIEEIGQLIQIKEVTGRQAAAARLAEGGGRLSMTQIREAIDRLAGAERRLLAEREIEAERATSVAVLTFAVVNLSALFMLVIAYAFAIAYLRRRRRSRELLEQAYGELEQRVQERTEELAQANGRLQREIEERRRAQGRLKREHGLLQLILNSLGDGVIVADVNGRMILFNPAGQRIMGIGVTDQKQDRWSEVYGIYEPGRDTLIPPAQLPLVRAFRGESFDDVEFHVRNARVPQGIDVAATGRPMRDEQGNLIGGVIIFRDITQKKKMAAEREEILRKMMEALAEVKTLSGLLPICAGCKSIRDDNGYWRRLEAYISEHSQAEFSHGLCPKCASELYPEAFPAAGTKSGA
jgi:CHASE3 domain sensor protein